jgi:hypothetical protein
MLRISRDLTIDENDIKIGSGRNSIVDALTLADARQAAKRLWAKG